MQGTLQVITQNKRTVTWHKNDVLTLLKTCSNSTLNHPYLPHKVTILDIEKVLLYFTTETNTYCIYYNFEIQNNKYGSATFYISNMEQRMRELQLNKIL